MLLLDLHHIVADGWSVGVLVRELGELYAALLAGRACVPARAPGPVRRLRGLAARLAARARCSRAAARLLAGAARRGARCWTCRPSGRARRRGSLAAASRPRCPASALGERRRDSRPPRGRDPLHGSPRGLPGPPRPLERPGRRRRGLADRGPHPSRTEGLIGFFVNTLVLRADLSGDADVPRARAAACARRRSGAYAHQDCRSRSWSRS